MENKQQGVTLDNTHIITVLQSEVNRLMQENVHLKAYIQQLTTDENEPAQNE
ncbi:hypothetical protein [Staphylococcus americanisciuri]|uniref:Phage protein n=1 Tax=Staphylococcus americanisciuri TaxID=2973940 RepID=A0ABT2F1R6_9STAP|nr:hypothetical protein [Staphylococcus americanisciuri]MCS4486391.1 hypothetical protein [Staphylococcus americanisciuri]